MNLWKTVARILLFVTIVWFLLVTAVTFQLITQQPGMWVGYLFTWGIVAIIPCYLLWKSVKKCNRKALGISASILTKKEIELPLDIEKLKQIAVTFGVDRKVKERAIRAIGRFKSQESMHALLDISKHHFVYDKEKQLAIQIALEIMNSSPRKDPSNILKELEITLRNIVQQELVSYLKIGGIRESRQMFGPTPKIERREMNVRCRGMIRRPTSSVLHRLY